MRKKIRRLLFDSRNRNDVSKYSIEKGLKLKEALILLCDSTDELKNFQLSERDWSLSKNVRKINVERTLQCAYKKLMKHYSKTKWVYCAILLLNSRHKKETFYLTPLGKEIDKRSIQKFE